MTTHNKWFKYSWNTNPEAVLAVLYLIGQGKRVDKYLNSALAEAKLLGLVVQHQDVDELTIPIAVRELIVKYQTKVALVEQVSLFADVRCNKLLSYYESPAAQQIIWDACFSNSPPISDINTVFIKRDDQSGFNTTLEDLILRQQWSNLNVPGYKAIVTVAGKSGIGKTTLAQGLCASSKEYMYFGNDQNEVVALDESTQVLLIDEAQKRPKFPDFSNSR